MPFWIFLNARKFKKIKKYIKKNTKKKRKFLERPRKYKLKLFFRISRK